MIRPTGEVVATLRQDVWLGTGDRRRGLRLGPFHAPPARILLHPGGSLPLDDPRLATFLQRLAESVELLAVEPASAGSDSARFSAWCQDLSMLVDWIGERWDHATPLVLCGIGAGASVSLAIAGHPAVRAVAAVGPTLPGSLSIPPASPAAVEKPVLIVVPRADPALDHASLGTSDPAWPLATWLATPGDTAAFLNGPLSRAIATWAIEVTHA